MLFFSFSSRKLEINHKFRLTNGFAFMKGKKLASLWISNLSLAPLFNYNFHRASQTRKISLENLKCAESQLKTNLEPEPSRLQRKRETKKSDSLFWAKKTVEPRAGASMCVYLWPLHNNPITILSQRDRQSLARPFSISHSNQLRAATHVNLSLFMVFFFFVYISSDCVIDSQTTQKKKWISARTMYE